MMGAEGGEGGCQRLVLIHGSFSISIMILESGLSADFRVGGTLARVGGEID